MQASTELDSWLLSQQVIFVFPEGCPDLFLAYTLDCSSGAHAGPDGVWYTRLDPNTRRRVFPCPTASHNVPAIRMKRRGNVIWLELTGCSVEGNAFFGAPLRRDIEYAQAILVIVHAERPSGVRGGISDLTAVPKAPCVELFDKALDRRRSLLARALRALPLGTSGVHELSYDSTSVCSEPAYHFESSGYTMSGEYIPEAKPKDDFVTFGERKSLEKAKSRAGNLRQARHAGVKFRSPFKKQGRR